MELGEVQTWERSFSAEEVRAFAEISGDKGYQHLQPDEHGRLIVHGLLTASLPTKLGGDMNFLARTMEFDFRRPVYTDETIRVEGRVAEVLGDHRLGQRVRLAFTCRNDTEVVMTGTSSGVIMDSDIVTN